MNKTYKKAKRVIIKKLGEVQSINVEPNWEGLYRFMMHLKKGDNAAFVRVTRKMGNDWEKLVAMAQKKKWQMESVNEGDVEDALKKYVKNPYGIGANRVNDEGKFYSLLFSDSHSREETIKKLIKKGILAKKMRKMMQPKGMEYRYELVLHKESVKEAIGSGATPEQMHKNLSTALKGAGFKVKKFEKMKWGFGGVWGGFYHVQDKREKDGKSVMPFHVKKDGKVSYDAGPRDWIIGNIDYPDVLKKELQKIKKMDGYGQDSIRKVGELKEAEAALPGNVKRFMEKFVDALDNTGLNRKRKVAVLAGIIDALDIEPQKLISMVNKIKSGIGVEGTIKEGVNKRLGWMDELIDQLGSEEKVLEEVFRALSDKEAKEVYDWIMRHWR